MHKTSTRYFLFFAFLIISNSAFCQQGNIWYFGENAGLDFNTTPPTALTNGQLNTIEGCASISDKNGNILFYTDGVKVYDRSHNLMPNGDGLMGDPSSTNSAIIIPKPGNPNIYYIFTADSKEDNYVRGYRYSEVDMRLNTGMGDITAQKNILLYAPSTERLTAVKHANGIDYWVITKGLNNDTFSVYKVDCSGINSNPVISNTGFVSADLFSGLGCIKASPDGKKVGMTMNGFDTNGQLFDFDNTTGLLSNAVTLTGFSPGAIYGVEFSPNSKLLYMSVGTTNIIYQYDITSNNPVIINASRYTVFTANFESDVALQLGPDKKLYAATFNKASLNVINNPDIYGVGCNLSIAGVNLNGRLCKSGLPSYISSFFDANNHVDFTSAFVDCHVQFTGTTDLSSSLQWLWDFGDGTTGTGQVINHSYRQIGTYTVTLKGIPLGNCASSDTFSVSHQVIINTIFAVDFNKTGNCFGDIYSFTDNTVLTIGNITGYAWDFGDGSPGVNTQNSTHVYSAPGSYNVKLVVSSSGICRADSIIKTVFIDTKPTAIFSPVNGCINVPRSFTDASINNVGGIGTWQWNFGDGGTSILQNPNYAYANTGPYTARLTVQSLHGCASDEVTHPVTIFDKPVADYTVSFPCINQGTVFTDISAPDNGNIIGWQWNFGDGGTSVLQNPLHIYNNNINYTTKLKVQSQYGCISEEKIIPVNIIKITAFAGRDTTAIYDIPLQLQATGGAVYEWSPITGLNNPFIGNPVTVLRNDITYTVKVTDINGCFALDDIFVKVYANNDVLVPNSFTPNGDGLNDILKPLGFGLKKIEYFKIFNRYGQLVFETNILDKGWDGTFKGKLQPLGAYTFMVKAINYRDRPVAHTGTVLLIR